MDEFTNYIYAVELTTNAVSDSDMVDPLIADIKQPILKLGGDGAYDQIKVYDTLIERGIQAIIPPRINAVMWTDKVGIFLDHSRNEALTQINEVGLVNWKRQSGYHRLSKAETAMFRWKTIYGERLSNRLLKHQQTEAHVKASYLNRFVQLGQPKTVRSDST